MNGRIIKQQRLPLPDYLRGFAVFIMILIHVLNEYGSHQLYEMKIFPALDFLAGPPAAPVFMAVMGFFFYLKNPSWQQAVKRGILLLLLGYLLNFLKGWFPVILAQRFWGFPRDYFSELFTPHYLMFSVEVLILAGLSFLLMAGLNRFTRKPLPIGLTALLILLVSPSLWGGGEGVPLLKHLIQPLWGQDTDFVIFPFFPWRTYALFGMVVAAMWGRWKDLDLQKLILRAFLSGMLLLASGGLLLILDFDRFFLDYGQQGWGAPIAFCDFVLLWGLLFLGISRIWPKNLKTGFLAFMSRNLTAIYVFQWILIGWLFLLIPYHSLNLLQSLAVFVIVTILSCLLAAIYRKIKDKGIAGIFSSK